MDTELLQVFKRLGLKERSERRYYEDSVPRQHNEFIETFINPKGDTEKERDENARATFTKWLDFLVANKAFVDDDPKMKKRLHTMLRDIAIDKETRDEYDPFDWHYWQLFREPLPPPFPKELAPASTSVAVTEKDNEGQKKKCEQIGERNQEHVKHVLRLVKECLLQEYEVSDQEVSLSTNLYMDCQFDILCFDVLSNWLMEAYPKETGKVFVDREIPDNLRNVPLRSLIDALFGTTE